MAGSDRPLLLFGKQNLDPARRPPGTNQRGPKLRLNLLGSTHATFEDIAVMLPQAARVLGTRADQVTSVVGTAT